MNILNSLEVNLLLNKFPNDIINNIKLHYYALIIQDYYRKIRYKFNRIKRFKIGDRVLFRHKNRYKFGTINCCIKIDNQKYNNYYIYNIESLEYINKQTHKNLSNNYISLYKNTSIYTTKLYKIVENNIYKLSKWKYNNKLSKNYNFYECDRIKHYFKINQKFLDNNKNSYLLNSLNYLTENEQIDFFYSLY